jgi:parvulin-like peptidyl-prolyl isomerase
MTSVTGSIRVPWWLMKSRAAVLVGVLLGVLCGYVVGRATSPKGLLASVAPEPRVAWFATGALGADDIRVAVDGLTDPRQSHAAVEQLVRARLLAQRAEDAKRHLTPDFLRRYSEELARVEIEKSFEEPFKKQLPTEDEGRGFFDQHRAELGRPDRVRVAHVALLAPASDADARAMKRRDAEKLLASARQEKDPYAFGRLALTRSEDPRSRPAAGELPFLTRDEIAARLGPEVVDVVFGAPEGRTVDHVLETAAGFQLVKVIAREEGREARYDELRDAIKARIASERREKAFKQFMDGVWASGDVKIDEKALEQLAGEKRAPDSGPHRPVAVAK